jgi:hypothetical protein
MVDTDHSQLPSCTMALALPRIAKFFFLAFRNIISSFHVQSHDQSLPARMGPRGIRDMAGRSHTVSKIKDSLSPT